MASQCKRLHHQKGQVKPEETAQSNNFLRSVLTNAVISIIKTLHFPSPSMWERISKILKRIKQLLFEVFLEIRKWERQFHKLLRAEVKFHRISDPMFGNCCFCHIVQCQLRQQIYLIILILIGRSDFIFGATQAIIINKNNNNFMDYTYLRLGFFGLLVSVSLVLCWRNMTTTTEYSSPYKVGLIDVDTKFAQSRLAWSAIAYGKLNFRGTVEGRFVVRT